MLLARTGIRESESRITEPAPGHHSSVVTAISEVAGDEITPEERAAIMQQQFSLTSVTSLTLVTRAHIASFVTMSRSITHHTEPS